MHLHAQRLLSTTARHFGLPPKQVLCRGCGRQEAESDVLTQHCAACAQALMAGRQTPSEEKLLHGVKR